MFCCFVCNILIASFNLISISFSSDIVVLVILLLSFLNLFIFLRSISNSSIFSSLIVLLTKSFNFLSVSVINLVIILSNFFIISLLYKYSSKLYIFSNSGIKSLILLLNFLSFEFLIKSFNFSILSSIISYIKCNFKHNLWYVSINLKPWSKLEIFGIFNISISNCFNFSRFDFIS